MDKDKILDDIFSNDPLGLLNVKPKASAARNADERLLASFQEINNFYEKNKREPEPRQNDISEYQLYTRLKGLRNSEDKMLALESVDKYNLLPTVTKEINTIDDIFGDDSLGIFDDDEAGLFALEHIPKETTMPDYVARRKTCKDFVDYELMLKQTQLELAKGKRKLKVFKNEQQIDKGYFFILNGVLLYVANVGIRKSDKNGKVNARLRCIFENGTESDMLLRSLAAELYKNGQRVTENDDKLLDNFNNITDEDDETGFIYVLKSKSTDVEITSIQNLYKIGFSKFDVQDRIKNAANEPTYLMAPVTVEGEWKCYNMNPHKFEQLLHNFFGNSCLDIDVFDARGRRHKPREWFVAPFAVIEQAIELIINGKVVNYTYDNVNKTIIGK
ncbi:GIY-YIG nuclease family protein [Ancylomarina sp. YFZ004]